MRRRKVSVRDRDGGVFEVVVDRRRHAAEGGRLEGRGGLGRRSDEDEVAGHRDRLLRVVLQEHHRLAQAGKTLLPLLLSAERGILLNRT